MKSPIRCLTLFYLLVFIGLSGFSHTALGVPVRVSADNDDAEERVSDGNMYRDSTDLELGYDDYVGGLQIVGMRFSGLNIPQGANINSAYIEFTTDETDSGTTNLVIYGENEDSPNQFGNNDGNISSRNKTVAFETWSPSAWNSVNGLHQTVDISRIIQEIVNRTGWSANNNLVIIIEPGSGCNSITCQRTAESHDGEPGSAPLLVVDYSIAPTNAIPVAEYRFDEITWSGSGADVLDSSGNALHGTAANVQPVSGLVCNAADFNGNNFIQVANNSLLEVGKNNSDYTVNFWVNLNTSQPGGWRNITHKGNVNNERTFAAWLRPGGSNEVHHRVSTTSSSNEGHDSVTAISANSWTMVSLVKEGNKLKTYFNGSLDKETTLSGDSVNNTGPLYLGKDPWYDGMVGLMDEYLVFANALSISEIQTIHTNQLAGNGWDGQPRTCPIPIMPIAEYRFDEESWNGSPNEVIDSSGNINNGTTVGGINTTSGKICNAANIPSNNSASIYQAVDTGLDLDTMIGSIGTISLWYKSNSDWNSGSDKRLFDATDGNKYFTAEIASDGRVKFWFEDGSDGDYQKTTINSFSVAAGVWKHLTFVWDVSSLTAKIFVDGVDQSLSGNTGATTAFTGFDTLYFGDNRDASYYTGQSSADGLIDEALVFDSVLTSAQIQTIFTNQDAGNNYDGSTRSCPAISCSGGTSGQLNAVGIRIDNGGSNNQINNTTEALSIYDAWLAAGSPATGLISGGTYNVAASGSSIADRIDFGGSAHDFAGTLAYPGAAIGVSGTHFLVHASGTLSLPAGDYTIAVESDDGFSFVMDTLSGDAVSFNKHGSLSGVSNELRFEDPTGNSNTRGSFTLTQDSVFDIAAIFFERTGGDYLEISIANDIRTNSAPSGYEILRHGALGGKVIFGQCLNVSGPDHYEISHGSSGITCEGSEVTITAHDAAHNAFPVSSDKAITVTTNPVVDNIISSPVTMLTGTSTVSFNLNHSAVLANIDIDVTDGSASDLDDAGGEDEVFEFRDTAFRFYANGVANDISKQVAGVNTAGQNLILKAIKTDDETGACVPALQGPSPTNVEIAYECNSPTSCSSTGLMSFEGQNLTGDDQGNGPSYVSVPMVFDVNGEADFNFSFADAGQITLRARKSVAANDPDPAFTLSATSNAFWVRPFELQLSAQSSGTDIDGNTSTSVSKHKASDPFDLAVRAVNASGLVTPNYRPGQLQLQLTRTGPLAGFNEGSLTYSGSGSLISALSGSAVYQNVTLESFVGGSLGNGISLYNAASYSEVGLINLDIQDINYGGPLDPILGDDIDIGRFIPHHFNVAVKSDGAFANACGSFTYLGQSFGYDPLSLPSLSIIAENGDNQTTKNYTDGDYQKLVANDISRVFPNQDGLVNGKDGLNPLNVTSNPAVPKGVISVGVPGESIFTFNANDSYFYNKNVNSEVIPFNNGQLSIATTSVVDSDGVAANNLLPSIDVGPTAPSIRYGRWMMKNTFGPETTNLAMNAYMEYLNASGVYVLNPLDNCTQITLTAASGTAGAGVINGIAVGGGTSDLSYNPTLINGDGGLLFTAPGSGNVGSILLNVDHSAQPWLQYDWNGDGSLQNHSGASATFGQYRGHDRIIYWREVSN